MDASLDVFARCDFCGCRSRLKAEFQRWPTGLRSRGWICPRCRMGGPPRKRQWFWVPLLAMLGVFAGFLAGGVPLAITWALGGIGMPVLLVAAHECAHAIAGRLAGATVFEIRLGWRQPWSQLRARGTRFTLARGFVRGGYCVAAFLVPPATRWRYAVLYGTPMVLHLVAAVLACFWLELPAALDEIGLLHFFFAHNVIFFFVSARPIDYIVGAYRIPNDGKALLNLLRDPRQVEGWWRPGFVLPAIYARSPEDALARARDVELMFPDDPAVQRALFTVYWALGQYAYALRFMAPYVAAIRQPERLDDASTLALGGLQGGRLERWLFCVVCMHGEAWEAALVEIDRQLQDESLPAARAMWLALRAYVRLLRGNGDLDRSQGQADARDAYEALPWVSFVTTIYGASLIDAGEREQGLARLADADLLDPGRHELTVRDAWRAIAMAELGRVAAARRCLREAGARGLEVGPPPSLLRRAKAALAGTG